MAKLFSEYWPLANHSKSFVTIGPGTGSGTMIRLPTSPIVFRYPGGANDGHQCWLALVCRPFLTSSDRLSM